MRLESKTKLIEGFVALRGKKRLRRTLRLATHGEKTAESVLMSLIRENKDTEFGRAHHFDRIRSVQDYQKYVPVAEYDDFEPYIKRMVRKGEQNLLTALPVVHYAQSSGSVGVPKYIPVTQKTVDLYSELGCSRTFALAYDYYKKRGIRLHFARGLNMIEINERFTEHGIPKGPVSATAIAQVKKFVPIMSTTPLAAVYPEGEMNQKYLKLLFALAERDLLFISCAFTTGIVDLMAYLEQHWESIVDDIAAGTINPGVVCPEKTRGEMEALLHPDPERAMELRAVFERGFDTPIIPRIWKNFRWIAAIGTGSFRPYTEKLKYYTGDLPADNLLYAASEAVFAAATEMDADRFLMLPQSGFFEFVPTESSDYSKTLTMDQLEVGKEYEIIVTNLSGLYRYRIKDVIKVLDYLGDTPYIRFSYRKSQLINMAGEKTTESAILWVISETEKETGFSISEYSVYADTGSSSRGRYTFFMETQPPMNAQDAEYCARVIDEKLGKANAAYRAVTESGEIDHCRVYPVQEQTYALYRDLMIYRGTSPNQIKPVRVIDNPIKEKFFKGTVINMEDHDAN